MDKDLIKYLCCPNCRGDLELEATIIEDDTIREGLLTCTRCKATFPITDDIPRFVQSENYTQSFGYEWNKHARTQIDKFNGTSISKERFFGVTDWPEKIPGEIILEAGCGAGRFTQIAVDTGALVLSFDYSNSVDANLRNNGDAKNLHIFQADIFNIPLRHGIFDKLFCLGVLQHTPDVKKAFDCLLPYLKDGGEVVFDIYSRFWFTPLMPKYILRGLMHPLINRMPSDKLYTLIASIVPLILPITTFLRKIPFAGKFINHLIPVANYKGTLPLSEEQLLDWSILDTYDTFSPRYDNPQNIENVGKWLIEAGLVNIELKYGLNGINAKGTKPNKGI